MNSEHAVLTPEERAELKLTALVRRPLEEHFANLEQQHEAASLGMWIFLATEVMFFGTLFLSLAVYRYAYPLAFEKGSEKLNWIIGGGNTVVLLVSSLFMVLAVHFARLGNRRLTCLFLALTAGLGIVFLGLKGLEYYIDYLEELIPGWRFNDAAWIREGLPSEEVPHVKLFLLFYWIMTGFHALHVTIGIVVILIIFLLARKDYFSPSYYSPVDVTGLYWHFVDIVWIFLLPMLYLLGTHSLSG